MRGDRKNEPISLWWLIIVASAIVIIVTRASKAQDDGYCFDCDPVDVSTDTALSIGGSDSLALGLSSPRFGAVINDCLGTTSRSFLFGLYGAQKLQENRWCMAANLIQSGYVDAGAWILCNHTILSKMPNCPGPFAEMVKADFNPDSEFKEKPEIIEIKQQFEIADSRYSDLVAKMDAMESQRQSAARAARQRQAEERAYNLKIYEQVKAVTEQ